MIIAVPSSLYRISGLQFWMADIREYAMCHYASSLLRILSFHARHASSKLVFNSEIQLGPSRSLYFPLLVRDWYPEEHVKLRLVWQ